MKTKIAQMTCTITTDNKTSWFIQCDAAPKPESATSLKPDHHVRNNNLYVLTDNTCDTETCDSDDDAEGNHDSFATVNQEQRYNLQKGTKVPHGDTSSQLQQGPINIYPIHEDNSDQTSQEITQEQCYNVHTGTMTPCASKPFAQPIHGPRELGPMYRYEDDIRTPLTSVTQKQCFDARTGTIAPCPVDLGPIYGYNDARSHLTALQGGPLRVAPSLPGTDGARLRHLEGHISPLNHIPTMHSFGAIFIN